MQYLEALHKVGLAEGKYTDDPRDIGGLTCCGIARNKNPQCEIWPIIDKYKARGLSLAEIEKITRNDPHFMGLVESFYRGSYWMPAHCFEVNPRLKYPMFSCAVNCGYKIAIKLYQKAVGVEADGLFGNKTYYAGKKMAGEVLERKFCDLWREYYKKIVDKKPEYGIYLRGWLNRVDNVIKDNNSL